MLALTGAAGSARAAFGGANGAVAYTGINARGEPALFVRRAGRIGMFLHGDNVANPAFSPWGQRIALNRDLPESGRAIWIFNTDGTDGRQLTASGAPASEPAWAPGGRAIAYAAGNTGARTIRLIATDGLGDRPLTAGPADQHSPAWSTNGKIAYVQGGPAGEDIYVVSARGGTPVRLTAKPGDDKDPSWAPGGSRLAYVRGNEGVWIINAGGRKAHKVVHVRGGVEHGVTWSPDGKRLIFGAGQFGARHLYTVDVNGKHLHAITSTDSDGVDPDWQTAGRDPVIAAGGDIACPPDGGHFNAGLGQPHHCAMMRTGNLLLRPDLWAVLVLGDLQYPGGDLGDYYNSFNVTWGRLRSLLRPTPGNHEYVNPGAAGYFDYFNGIGAQTGRFGDRSRGGYYSFDVGKWHIIALDSNCTQIPGGCDDGSPEQRWLLNDLIAHPAPCTLAFWHHPLFSSLSHEEGRGSKQTRALWQTLYDHGADVVLSGHQHFYERLEPVDQDGDPDPAEGIRSFVVGTGGKDIDQADYSDPNSADFDATTFGILEMTLHPHSYEWRFQATSRDPFPDSGEGHCH